MGLCPNVLYKNLSKDLVDAFGIDGQTLASFDVRDAGGNSSLAYAVSIAKSLLKKWEPLEASKTCEDRAISLFNDCNSRCASWSPHIQNPLFQRVLDEMAFIADKELTRITWFKIYLQSRTGPGASVLSNGRNSSFEKLFLNRLSTTSMALYKAYRRCCQVFPLHYAAELRRCEVRGCQAVRTVEGSTLSTVRKTTQIDRTICTEPSLNMFFQLGIAEELNSILRQHYGYDPEHQPDRNRRMACEGSKGNGFATIDLSSASDTISLQFVKYVLRSDWFAVIDDTRSPVTKVNGKYMELHMVSSMGNGYTFALQTYLFSLMIKALCKVLDVDFTKYDSADTRFGVFGDDIIVPDSMYDTMCELLKALGFQPNVEKSFSQGAFRESCGTDWLAGENIRGVYIRKLDTIQERFSAINRLNLFSVRSMIPLRRTIRYLLPKNWKRYLIPMYENADAGIWATRSQVNSNYYLSFEPNIQYHRFCTRSGHLYARYDNIFGVVLSACNGSLSSSGVTRRQRVTTYLEVQKVAPFWGYPPFLKAHNVSLANWGTMSHYNLEL